MHLKAYKQVQQPNEMKERTPNSSHEWENNFSACDHVKKTANVKENSEEAHKTKYGLSSNQMPEVFRTPFIVSGYRRPGLTFCECIKSLLRSSNETINVWSHLLALVLFVSVNMTSLPMTDSFFLPLISFAMGISVLYLMSSSAHLFNCMSEDSHRICFFFDYAAIGFYTFTAGQAMFFYSRTAGASTWALHDSLAIFQSVSTFFSFFITFLCCASNHPRCKDYKAVLRVAVLAVNWLVITSPYTVRILLCEDADPA